MSLKDKLQQIDQLQQTIQKHGKLSDDLLKRINYKFRLEWNYNSNSMEGNSLTRQETRTVMVGNITVDGKPIQDVLEMKRHDDVIASIIKMGKGELNISETRIKEIHAGIMYEEDPERAEQIGKWKKSLNYLYNYKNERFDFVAPGDVHERMHQLVDWVSAQKEKMQRGVKDALHPVQLALKFHLDYITIHPFYDGNGRTARILTNLILISYGYPPLYVKVEEKAVYYQYLGDIQGYGGEPDLFYEFMAGLVIRSQEIVLNAIEGKSIEEPEDLDKRLFLIEKELEAVGSENDIEKHLNKEVFIEIYDTWLIDLLKKGIVMVQKFNHLFKGSGHHISIQGVAQVGFVNEAPEDIINKLSDEMHRNRERLNIPEINVLFRTYYGTFKKTAGLNTFGSSYGFEIRFGQIKYEIVIDQIPEQNEIRPSKRLFSKLLHKPLSEKELNLIVDSLGNVILSDIDNNTKKMGLR